MKSGDKVTLKNCDLARTNKGIFIVISYDHPYWIIHPIDDNKTKYFARENWLEKVVKKRMRA